MKVFYHGDMDGIASGYLLCKNIIPKQTVVDAKNLEIILSNLIITNNRI